MAEPIHLSHLSPTAFRWQADSAVRRYHPSFFLPPKELTTTVGLTFCSTFAYTTQSSFRFPRVLRVPRSLAPLSSANSAPLRWAHTVGIRRGQKRSPPAQKFRSSR